MTENLTCFIITYIQPNGAIGKFYQEALDEEQARSMFNKPHKEILSVLMYQQ